jgi:DnaJ like chaperone protein
MAKSIRQSWTACGPSSVAISGTMPQLFHYLVQIATSDGTFSKSEKSVLEAIGTVIRLGGSDVNSVIAMFYRDAESAYAVLEILPTASNDEVRAAYRRMAGCFRASWS